MSEERLNSLDSHVQQLIQMVAENNKMMTENSKMVMENNKMVAENMRMTKELSGRMDRMEQAFQEEKQLNELRHKEVLKELRSNQVDIDYLRNQVSKHDMEIHKLKATLQSNT
jgi:hypothetical protein